MGTCAKKYVIGIVLCAVLIGGHVCASLAQLAEPKDGRVCGRPAPGEMPKARKTTTITSGSSGRAVVLLDEKGPGVITHIWLTFLGPEPQAWAKNGSGAIRIW
jgi:hypothetical protein